MIPDGRGQLIYYYKIIVSRSEISSTEDTVRCGVTPQTVVYKKGSEFPQKFLIHQLGGGYEMINLM